MNKEFYDPYFDQVKKELQMIFIFYCSFADRQNYNKLKIQNFRRMLEDSQLINSSRDIIKIDLIFSSTKKSEGIDFNTFLEIIPLLVKRNNCINKQEVKNLVNNNFHALYQYLMDETEFGQEAKAINKVIFTEQCFQLLKKNCQTLTLIYNFYFDPKITKIVRQKQQIFKILLKFLKDYEVIPSLASKTFCYLSLDYLLAQLAHSVYEQWFQVKNKNSSCPLTFFKFLQFIVMISNVTNKKIYGFKLSPVRNLAGLLDRLSVSRGFIRLTQKNRIKANLVTQQEQIAKLEKIEQDFFGSLKVSPQKQKAWNQKNHSSYERMRQLRQKFTRYCMEGQTIGKPGLTHKKIFTMFQSFNSRLKQQQLEIILCQNFSGLIDFNDFMRLLQISAAYQNLELEDRIQQFIRNSGQINKTTRYLVSDKKQSYQKCFEMIQFLSGFLKSVFDLEANTNINQQPFLTVEKYLKLMYDFEVIPKFIIKDDIIVVFEESTKDNKLIMKFTDFKRSFLNSLKNLQNINPQISIDSLENRLIFLVERMNFSRGCKLMAEGKKSEDFLIQFRRHYNQYYQKEQSSRIQTHQEKLRKYLQ